jgi:phage terminase small subunit
MNTSSESAGKIQGKECIELLRNPCKRLIHMPPRKDKNHLTQKECDFCLAYIELGNATEAYRRIYSTNRSKPSNASRAAYNKIHTPKIAAKIAELQSKAETKAVARVSLTREMVIRDLLEVVEIAMGRKLTKLKIYRKAADKIEDVEVSKFDMGSALRALELLGKVDTIGLFVERSKVDLLNRFEAMSDDELEEFISSRLH